MTSLQRFSGGTASLSCISSHRPRSCGSGNELRIAKMILATSTLDTNLKTAFAHALQKRCCTHSFSVRKQKLLLARAAKMTQNPLVCSGIWKGEWRHTLKNHCLGALYNISFCSDLFIHQTIELNTNALGVECFGRRQIRRPSVTHRFYWE